MRVWSNRVSSANGISQRSPKGSHTVIGIFSFFCNGAVAVRSCHAASFLLATKASGSLPQPQPCHESHQFRTKECKMCDFWAEVLSLAIINCHWNELERDHEMKTSQVPTAFTSNEQRCIFYCSKIAILKLAKKMEWTRLHQSMKKSMNYLTSILERDPELNSLCNMSEKHYKYYA